MMDVLAVVHIQKHKVKELSNAENQTREIINDFSCF
jgi:hypothetical protein